MFLIDPGFFNIVKCKQRNAMTLSQLLSSFLGTPKSDNFNFERLLNLSIALSMEEACVWWFQRHICCHCLSPQSPPTPGQMCLYAVVGMASLPAALPMHSSVEAHSSFQLHQIQWRYSHKYPLRPGDNLLPTFYLLQHQKSVILCLVLVITMVSEAAPAKGGSKSMMKNRSALRVRTTFHNFLNSHRTRERHPNNYLQITMITKKQCHQCL